MKGKRIEILDSFRFLAIISVILFHYTYRWTLPVYSTNLYPYGSFFGDLFKYGNKGVQFFFIISGFVISYTLENTTGLSTFFKNRFIRLFPPIFIWSVITYVVFTAFDNHFLFPDSHSIKNFLPSLTFINPEIWSLVLKKNFSNIDGSYWSLWVEVQFYIIAAITYFINKKNFFRNMLLVTIAIAIVNYLARHFIHNSSHLTFGSIVSKVYYINSLFNITSYICFFTLGIVFHHLYKEPSDHLSIFTGLCSILIFLYQLYACVTFPVRIIYLLIIALFLVMVYKREYLFFLENRYFKRIGVISYSLYLLHENIGVLLINRFGGYLGKWSPLSVFIVTIAMIILSEFSYRFIEQPLGRLFKKRKRSVSASRQTATSFPPF